MSRAAGSPATAGAATIAAADVATARLCWQMGDWPALAALPVDLPPPGGSSGAGRIAAERIEMLLYKAQGLFLTGALEEARALVAALRGAGISRPALAASLLSGAQSNVARAWMGLGKRELAQRATAAAMRLNPGAGDPALTARLRLAHEAAQLAGHAGAPFGRAAGGRRLFIDCGAYDGCSALMFLISNPEFDCVSFEPNPDLWPYFEGIPTTLIRKAAYTFDGEVDFTIDPVDGDGSTLVSGKRIDFTRKVENADCPVLGVPCVDLSRFVREAAEEYDEIVLKLDVEGAEYDILEKMLADGTVALLGKLYCEFHGHKMALEEGRHDRVVEAVGRQVAIEFWDALPFSFNQPEVPKERRKRRDALVAAVRALKEKFG